MNLLIIPGFIAFIALLLVFPKKDRTPGRKTVAWCMLGVAAFFTVQIFTIDYVYNRVGDKYYVEGTITQTGPAKDGGFFEQAGCYASVRTESGHIVTPWIPNCGVVGMKVYKACEGTSCYGSWVSYNELSPGHRLSRS
ncbi:hypothetical protein JOAD_163 [Erwinia phage vB_EamM_Joad]|uniref:Uncharacterized protein n=1 Tax=Erwinia phage vB_EamM_Joad TaxID=2026081 RepID=A0A223LID8_9CAUD|nr:hypothetical protein JOAD_163 [Erwinia phage vB_EamM_Joad]